MRVIEIGTALGRAPGASLTRLRAPAACAGAAALTWVVAVAAARGDQRGALLVLGGIAALALAWQPQIAFVLALVLGASILPYGSLRFAAAGIRSDLVEALVLGLITVWLLSYALGQNRIRTPFALPILMLGAGIVAGTAVGLGAGAPLSQMLGPVKAWTFYLLAIPLASWFATQRSLTFLRDAVVRICVVGSVVTLAVTALGLQLPFLGTRPLGVSTLGVSAVEDVQRIRPDLVNLLVLATLLVAMETAVDGITVPRFAVLGVFTVMHAVTYTRSTWVPLVIALVGVAVIHPGRRLALRGLRSGLIAVVTLAAVLTTASTGALGASAEAIALRATSVIDPDVVEENSYRDRENENAAALASLSARPLTGVGINQPYGARRVQYRDNPPRLIFVDRGFIHNQYLYAWLQLGVLGILALVLLSVVAVRVARQARIQLPGSVSARVLAACLTLFAFGLMGIFQTIVIYPAHMLAALCAVTLAVAPEPETDPIPTDPVEPTASR